eukprot:TRINITY_DN42867_c0_g1_i1.p1 TRINITY_DN42867_c0_g1~~TRINITY_DN42867_c0_g1_i1.p1  ORF type:complete len:599 (-),score=94.39 TRINITY_DN42867_c0_g1_i1:24-1778(-)
MPTSAEPPAEPALGAQAVFSLLLVARLAGALLAPIMDCDETFNYMEPVHYVTHGSGMQTWEYSPQFALRSYAFVELYALPVRLAKAMGMDKVQTFYFLRACLGTCSAGCEALFCDAVARSAGRRIGILVCCFLIFASGMFHAAVAVLPSTTCMYAVLLGFAAWLRGHHSAGMFCGSFAVLLGMAVAVPMFVPMGVDALRPQNLGPTRVFGVAVASLLAFALIPTMLDWHYYGTERPLWTMGNHLLYNFGIGGGGGAGADLYGTESWTFYFKNLALNFNIVAILALPALFSIIVVAAFPSLQHRQGLTGLGATPVGLLVVLSPMYITLAMFTKMAHKEERFLTMLYPLICLAGAVTVDAALSILECSAARFFGSDPASPRARRRWWPSAALAALLVAATSTLSASRSAALHFHFRAPLRLFERLYYEAAAVEHPQQYGVCLGKEWYRFPSSFFLPEGLKGVDDAAALPLLWLNSSFDGQLPRPFGPWPRGLSDVPPHMNDMNQREPSRYSKEEDCGFLIDLELDNQAEAKPNPESWAVLHCEPFLDAEHSPLPWRAFYVPFGISNKRNAFGRYCLWQRRHVSVSQ